MNLHAAAPPCIIGASGPTEWLCINSWSYDGISTMAIQFVNFAVGENDTYVKCNYNDSSNLGWITLI